MGLFKAISKLIARTASDKICENEKRNAPKKAYTETGKELEKANKNGKYANGSKIYHQKKDELTKKADAKNENRKKFFDDVLD